MDIYFQFIGAVFLLMIVPGADMAYCIACGMSKGVKGAFFAATGIGVGGLVLTLLTTILIYFSDIISPDIFIYIQIVGCIYLLYLGVKILIPTASGTNNTSSKTTVQDYKNIFIRGIITNISNPKALVFFLSFLPQFVPTNSSNVVFIIFTLGVLLCVIGSVMNFVFGVSGIGLHSIASKTFLNRSVEQYVTALVFIAVATIFLSNLVIS